MRLFIAIQLPIEIENYVKRLQSFVQKGKFSFAEQPHLTLKFLGEVEDYETIKSDLSKITFKSFDLETSRLGFFPNENYIRVFWLGLKECDALADLARRVEKVTSKFKRDLPFHAHITLARVKFLDDRDKFFEAINKIELENLKFSVDRFLLMSSTMTPSGPIYEIVEEFEATQ